MTIYNLNQRRTRRCVFLPTSRTCSDASDSLLSHYQDYIYSIFEISVKYQFGSNSHTKLRILVSVTSVGSLTNCQVFYVVSIFHVSRLGARGVKDKREYTVTNGGAISAYVSVMHNTINRL